MEPAGSAPTAPGLPTLAQGSGGRLDALDEAPIGMSTDRARPSPGNPIKFPEKRHFVSSWLSKILRRASSGTRTTLPNRTAGRRASRILRRTFSTVTPTAAANSSGVTKPSVIALLSSFMPALVHRHRAAREMAEEGSR